MSKAFDKIAGRRSPDAPARTLLSIVDADPKAAMALIDRVMG